MRLGQGPPIGVRGLDQFAHVVAHRRLGDRGVGKLPQDPAMNAPRRVTLLARRATVLFEQLVNKIPHGAEMIGALREVCAGLPDQRKDPRRDGDYAMADIGLAAFSIFFMGSPSFLGHQRALAEGHGRLNCETLFGMAAIPSDNYMRLMLDGPAAIRLPADRAQGRAQSFKPNAVAEAGGGGVTAKALRVNKSSCPASGSDHVRCGDLYTPLEAGASLNSGRATGRPSRNP